MAPKLTMRAPSNQVMAISIVIASGIGYGLAPLRMMLHNNCYRATQEANLPQTVPVWDSNLPALTHTGNGACGEYYLSLLSSEQTIAYALLAGFAVLIFCWARFQQRRLIVAIGLILTSLNLAFCISNRSVVLAHLQEITSGRLK